MNQFLNAGGTRRDFMRTAATAGAALAGWSSESNYAMNNPIAQAPARDRKLPLWKAHPVAKIPDGYQVAVADVNGDGKLDILALSSEESIVAWYENPSWRERRVTSETHGNISLAPLFQPGYPLRGMALASGFALDASTSAGDVWWTEPSSPDTEWRLHLIGRIPTSHRLRWADLDGDGRLELVDAPILGPGARPPDYRGGAPLSWFEPPEALLRGHASAEDQPAEWTSHLIDSSLTVIHGIHVLDWDGDGRHELLIASFEGVHLFHSSGRGASLRWTKTHLAAGDQASSPRRGSSEIDVGTVRGRRFLATIEPWHGEEVVVYFEGKTGELWDRRVIDTSFHDGHALACADLDGDGDTEIVAGYRGPGTSLYAYYAVTGSGQDWQRQTLDTGMAASCVVIADINGDRRPDVVAVGASTGNVVWYENGGVEETKLVEDWRTSQE